MYLLKNGQMAGCCERGSEPSDAINCWNNLTSCDLLPSEEGLFCVELFHFLVMQLTCIKRNVSEVERIYFPCAVSL
jgi:hypothetical protein